MVIMEYATNIKSIIITGINKLCEVIFNTDFIISLPCIVIVKKSPFYCFKLLFLVVIIPIITNIIKIISSIVKELVLNRDIDSKLFSIRILILGKIRPEIRKYKPKNNIKLPISMEYGFLIYFAMYFDTK